jgi:hypothetical protein
LAVLPGQIGVIKQVFSLLQPSADASVSRGSQVSKAARRNNRLSIHSRAPLANSQQLAAFFCQRPLSRTHFYPEINAIFYHLFAFAFKREIYVVMVQFEKIKDRHPDGRERVPRFRRGPRHARFSRDGVVVSGRVALRNLVLAPWRKSHNIYMMGSASWWKPPLPVVADLHLLGEGLARHHGECQYR